MPKESPRETYSGGESSGTGWLVGIIVTLALLSIGYLVFSAGHCRTDACAVTAESAQRVGWLA